MTLPASAFTLHAPDQAYGIWVAGQDTAAGLEAWLTGLGLRDAVQLASHEGGCLATLHPERHAEWMAGHDTTGLAGHLGAGQDSRTTGSDALLREITVALAGGPLLYRFDSLSELQASTRIRRNIALAARKTALSFDTEALARPEEDWRYEEGRGFILLPGRELVPALRRVTQPRTSGTLYAFSCYRATEYVILLGMAQELATTNPLLLERLTAQWRRKAIQSAAFHDSFLQEVGSIDEPLPKHYYVPGDRVWFRNPDEASADAAGYEGSWVIYLGGGEFGDFWREGRAYTLRGKCIELYHWRHAVYQDAQGEWRMDEAKVEALVAQTLADPPRAAVIVEQMMNYRAPRGVWNQGGCIDASREFPLPVCPGTERVRLP